MLSYVFRFHGAAGRPPASDEISLRDLYLILKRRAAAIAIVAVAAALVAFAVVALQPARYVAEATAVIARAPADIEFGSGLRFRPEVNIGLDTYRTLAFSRPVLQEVSELFDVPLQSLEARLELVTLSSSAAFLAVDHKARAETPDEAAAIANAWADISVLRAKNLLLESLDVVELITGGGLDGARERVGALEERLAEVSSRRAASLAEVDRAAIRRVEELLAEQGDALAGLNVQPDFEALLRSVDPDAPARTTATPLVDREASPLRAAIAAVQRELRQADSDVRTESAQLERLRASAVDGASALVLGGAPTVTLTRAGAIASAEAMLAAALERQVFLRAELAALEQRLRDETAALLAFELAFAELQGELRVTRTEVELAFQREIAQLRRSLDDALLEYQTLAPIEPGVALAAQIAPAGARVLSGATAPLNPESDRALLIALIAAVVAAFGGVVMALLAEAVRDPYGAPAGVPARAPTGATPARSAAAAARHDEA